MERQKYSIFVLIFFQLMLLAGCTETRLVRMDEEKRWKSPGTRPYPKLPYPKFAFTATYEYTPQEPLHGRDGSPYHIRIMSDGKGHLVTFREQAKKDGAREFVREGLEDWNSGVGYQLIEDATTKKDVWQAFYLSPDIIPCVAIYEPSFKQFCRRSNGVHPEPLGTKMIEGKRCRGWREDESTFAWFGEENGIEVESLGINLSRLKEYTTEPFSEAAKKNFVIPKTSITVDFFH